MPSSVTNTTELAWHLKHIRDYHYPHLTDTEAKVA